jgi:hypothetical protein
MNKLERQRRKNNHNASDKELSPPYEELQINMEFFCIFSFLKKVEYPNSQFIPEEIQMTNKQCKHI